MAQDGEGPGEYIGGRASYAERECIAPKDARTILMSGNCNGQVYTINGPAGAPYVDPAELYIDRAATGKREVFRTIDMTEIYPGDVLVIKTISASGWGNPIDRDVERIRKDVSEGLLSIQRAKNIYGVILDPETLEVNAEATEQLRKEMRGKESR